MSDILKPRDAKEVEDAVRWALGNDKALELVGQGTKRAIGRPSQTDLTLDLSGLSGVTLYEPEELVRRCELVAVTRPGYDPGCLRAALSPEMLARTHLLDMPRVDISSTELRERVAAGKPLRYLTAEAVVGYIQERGLYRTE